jgi:S1-C subfamily serine protease
VLIALAACAGTASNEEPRAPEAKAVVPGTIGAVVGTAGKGVQVEALAPDGPAARAGLRAGDVIVGFRGQPVGSVRTFNARVLGTPPGERLRLQVVRDGHPLSVEVDVRQLRTAWWL